MLNEKEMSIMIQLLQQNGCQCSNEKREVFWNDELARRKMLCRCGSALVVPIFIFQ